MFSKNGLALWRAFFLNTAVYPTQMKCSIAGLHFEVIHEQSIHTHSHHNGLVVTPGCMLGTE